MIEVGKNYSITQYLQYYPELYSHPFLQKVYNIINDAQSINISCQEFLELVDKYNGGVIIERKYTQPYKSSGGESTGFRSGGGYPILRSDGFIKEPSGYGY